MRSYPEITDRLPASQHKVESVSLFDLAPGGVYRTHMSPCEAVSSYLTFSPLRSGSDTGTRFAFCGTFLGVAPTGRYPAPLPCGARTLPPTDVEPSASGHLLYCF